MSNTNQIVQERIAALRHWQKMFLNGTVHDEHAEFIVEVFADKVVQLEHLLGENESC